MKTIKEINIPEIDISEIDAKSKEIEENINYDEVRDRIRQVLEKITDKKNRGKKVSQDTIGKYLFPHLGADSSTQSTMSPDLVGFRIIITIFRPYRNINSYIGVFFRFHIGIIRVIYGINLIYNVRS